MRGLAVRPSAGLGGATVVARRPLSVPDYRHASGITHDYDGPVLSEGIRSILAVPVVVDGRARAVLYGAYRQSAPIGDRTAAAMVSSARRLGRELAVRDEVDRRLRLREAHLANFGDNIARAEQIREVHAEMRRLAVRRDPHICRAGFVTSRACGRRRPTVCPPLTSRELDVLAQVAMGCTNAEAGRRLSLKPETVKSYLRSAAVKLGTRRQARGVSRRGGRRLIP